VDENKKLYTKCQFKQAKQAHKLFYSLGCQSINDMKAIIQMNAIKNNPVATEDVDIEEKIFGPDMYDEMDSDAITALNDPTTLQDEEGSIDSNDEQQPQVKEPDEEEESEEESKEEQDPNPTTAKEQTIPHHRSVLFR
jgi:hypothetical protein